MFDQSRLIIEVADLVVDTSKDQISLDRVPEAFRKKAESINRCLKYIRVSEKRLFALQQKLIEDSKERKDSLLSIQPFAPDLNLLNQELLIIAKKAAPEIFQQFVQTALVKEQQRQKQEISDKKARGEPVNPNTVVQYIPRVVDAVIFLNAPYEIFPFLDSVREMICLVSQEERRLYLLNYMERWIYKFTEFLESYATGLGKEALFSVCFLGKHQHFPVILEVIKFLHKTDNWEGPADRIQRYNVVRLFLIFKQVLYLYLKRKQPVPKDFVAILSEFTHPFIVEELHFSNDPLLIITLGYYHPAQRFQILASLRKRRLQEFVALYQHLLMLADPSSPQSHTMKGRYLEILKTIKRIIHKSHMLSDPEIEHSIRNVLKRELSRQVLAEESYLSATAKLAAGSNPKMTVQQKLAMLHKRAQTAQAQPAAAQAKVPEAAPAAKPEPSKKQEVLVSPPPAPVEIEVFNEVLIERDYEVSTESSYPLVPDQVSKLEGWQYSEVQIFGSFDTFYFLFGNFKARGALKFTEMLELARIPFRFQYLTRAKERHLRFVNIAHWIAMNMGVPELEVLLPLVVASGQLTDQEAAWLKEMWPQLLDDKNLGALRQMCPDSTSVVVDGLIKTRLFFDKLETIQGNLLKTYPWFQQLPGYYDFLNQTLFHLAQKLDRDKAHLGYHALNRSKLKKYLAKQQVDLFNRIVKELKMYQKAPFLQGYLGPKLNELMEFKITPDLYSLMNPEAVELP